MPLLVVGLHARAPASNMEQIDVCPQSLTPVSPPGPNPPPSPCCITRCIARLFILLEQIWRAPDLVEIRRGGQGGHRGLCPCVSEGAWGQDPCLGDLRVREPERDGVTKGCDGRVTVWPLRGSTCRVALRAHESGGRGAGDETEMR